MNKILIQILLGLTLVTQFGLQPIFAQDSSTITGIWKTFDDDTYQPAALVEITLKDGIYSGVIKKILDPSAQPTCEKCTDSRKGKPVLGMEILTGLKKSGESYGDGRIYWHSFARQDSNLGKRKVVFQICASFSLFSSPFFRFFTFCPLP